MKIVTRVQTFDGATHDTSVIAQRYLDRLYADSLCELAHKLVHIEKYAKMCEWIDANLGAFEMLQVIKQDMTVVPLPEDDE